MKLPKLVAALTCAALTMPSIAFAHHLSPDGRDAAESAEAIRELNMMLMATSLRCRQTRFDFRSEYKAFTRFNLHHLNRAHADLLSNLTVRYGKTGGIRALDRKDSDLANRYGNGHPWLNCAELYDLAGWIAVPLDRTTLAEIAADLTLR